MPPPTPKQPAAPPNPALGYETLVLAGVGGSVDAIGYFTFAGLFMGFMSGNSTLLGLHLGQGQWAEAGRFFFPILLFTLGVFCGALLAARRVLPALLLVALLWQVGGHFTAATLTTAYFYPRVALLAGAMGVQAGAFRRVGSQSIHTTFVTGDLTSLAALGAASLAKPAPPASPPTAAAPPADLSAGERKGLLGSVWLIYVLGAAAGAFTFKLYAREALLLPLLAVVVVIGLSLVRKPAKAG